MFRVFGLYLTSETKSGEPGGLLIAFLFQKSMITGSDQTFDCWKIAFRNVLVLPELGSDFLVEFGHVFGGSEQFSEEFDDFFLCSCVSEGCGGH